jgi:hypothetical protein
MPLALAQNLCWPVVLPGSAQHNARAMEAFGKVTTEWLDFIRRRVGEDVRLAAQLTASKSPAEAWSLYAGFLQQAMQDYWNEAAAMTRLTSGVNGPGADPAEGRKQEAASEAAPRRQAA